MSDELLPIVTGIAQDTGELKGMVASIGARLLEHVESDANIQREIFNRVSALEQTGAKQRGSAAVWLLIAAAAGALLDFFGNMFSGSLHK
jgi:hypothetical protein